MRLFSLLALLIGFALTTLSPASALDQTGYKSIMAELDANEALIRETALALATGMTQSDAKSRLPHLKERLQWMRDTKVEAAKVDTRHTLRTRNAESQRARCIIMRAGLMDASFQDVMVNVSMKARGAADNQLIPASAASLTSSNTIFRCGSL
tara:strand:+ start:41214 stop:41672 length:459 start_codon:yes stop_codon:yes gene_type:complete